MKNTFPLLMKSVAAFTCAATVVLIWAYLTFRQDWLLTGAISFGTTAYHFVMRLLVGYAVPKITHYNFDYRHPWFQPRSWEHRFYQMAKLRRWKGKLPTYAPGQFSLEENSLHRVIQNMCGAELVHEIIMLFSFLPVFATSLFGSPGVFWSTSVCAALFDSLFVMAQRYNRPRLVRIYQRKSKEEAFTQS